MQQIKAQNVNDKVLSIGERSEIKIDKTYVIDSEIGIVVKDASKVKIKNLNFENVKLPVATYIKKEEFGKPEVFIGKIIPENAKDFLISSDTLFTIGDSRQKTSLSSKYIEGILYGNQFGVKTKR